MTIDEWIKNGKPWNVILHGDCMDLMKHFNDKEVSLSIVDPPYFDGPQKSNYYRGTKQKTEVGQYKDLSNNWKIPDKKYFDELFRISKNQIIWGINYFNIALPGGRIVWIKGIEKSPFSMCDIAYQSFYNRIDMFKYLWSGFWQEEMKNKEIRIHPTQKPVALYRWLLQNYAKPNDKIIDTHSGSGSLACACHLEGFEFLAIEKDEDYFNASVKRLEEIRSQGRLFV